MSIIKAKEKSNKIHENIIGKIIYGFLLFAPLLMILTTSCYAIFNKNAFESYYGENINESITTLVGNNLQAGKEYTISIGNVAYDSNEQQTEVILNVLNVRSDTIPNVEQTTNIKIRSQNGATFCLFYNGGTYIIDRSYSSSSVFTATFTFVSKNNVDLISRYQTISETTYNKYSYLDNNFDYGIYKTEQSQYFNWSKSTTLYTGLRTTCQSLGIENTFTPMLMAYWLLISIIYFIFDIGLIMVHIVHRKIHEFTESV